MASTPDRDMDDEFNEPDSGEPFWSDPEPPNSEQECSVSIEVLAEGEEVAEVWAHGEAYDENFVKAERKVLLARLSRSELVTFPLVSASFRDEFLHPKYERIATIRIPGDWDVPSEIDGFDEMLDELPVGFSRHARRGLGLRYEYRLIIEAIESATEATELVLADGDVAVLGGSTFTLGRVRFERTRRALDAIVRRARQRSLQDRRILAFNEVVHRADQGRFPKKFRQPQPGEIFELVQLSSRETRRSESDRSAAADLVRRDAPQIAQENPRALMELRSEIERVTLGQLIDRFERLMARNPTEPVWQQFFESNPFVLSIAYPYPVMLVRGQAHVGGTRLDGRGESIADFLFRQRLTGGIAIFEIKTTQTPLLERRPFRGDLFGPNKLLCASISQVLDQRSELVMNFHSRAGDPGMEETHVGHVHCLVIAGRDPNTPQRRRSLDLFRNATKDVTVVTFDELLEKLRAIHRLMSPQPPAVANPAVQAAPP